MLLKIFKNRTVSSSGTWGTKNENNYEILNFEFPEELEEYNKRIVYYLGNQKVWDPIIDNKAILTNAITTKGSVKAYIWCTKTDAQYETDVDFRTQIFVMNFFENDNADGIVPTPEQVDGFNTMLTAMNEKIEEIDELETTIENAETQRQENEETRQENENTRQENEQTRQKQEAERERRTDEAIGNIEDKTAEYNANAEAKTNEFNDLVNVQKLSIENYGETQLNAIGRKGQQALGSITTTTQFALQNISLAQQTGVSAVETASSEAITNFNTNATNKTNAFNSNATEKTTTFDNNASTKTTDFNTNATSKTNDFNDNATEKTTAYNENAQEKIDEYDEHIADYQAQIDELQEEVEELSENMPWNTTEQATEISVDDAAKYSRNKLELFGNTSQKSYQGYNLIDVSPYQEETKNGVTLTKDDEGNIILNGTSTGAFGWNVSLPETRVLSAGTYTKSIAKNNSVWTGLTVSMGYNNSSISGTTIQPNTGTATMVREQDTNYNQIRMYIGNGTTFDNYKLSYMILSGEYTAQTIPNYEPYVGGPSPNPDYPQDIHVVTGNNSVGVQGKNLLKYDDILPASITKKGVSVSIDTNGVITINGTATGEVMFGLVNGGTGLAGGNISSTTQNNLPLNSNITYTLSCNRIEGTQPSNWHISSRMVGLGWREPGVNRAMTFSGTSGVNEIYIYVATNETFNNFKFTLQLEQGSTATSYVSYYHTDYPINLGSLELCKIGDYQDYLYKENGNWYKYEKVTKRIFTKSDNFSTGSFGTNSYQIGIGTAKKATQGTNNEILILSNLFRGIDFNKRTTSGDNIIYMESERANIYIRNTRFSTLSDFKAYLQNNNMVSYYVRENARTTQITDETLISQLDAIYNHLALVKGTNHITITPSDLEPYVTLNYMQDLPAKLDNLDSRLSLLE